MSLRHATLHQLRIFHAVAQNGSFARAAEALHLSPPTLSLQVKQLSESVGQPLFEQLGKKIYLTAAGTLAVWSCEDIESAWNGWAKTSPRLQGVERGSVKLAILTTVKYTVPKLLGGFCAAHPGIDVAMVVGNREKLLQRLAGNEDDLYIMGQPPDQMDVVSEAFADNPLVLVAPPDHPLGGKKRIAPERLRSEPFILREPGSGTRLTSEKFFTDHGITMKNRLEVGSNEGIKQPVRSGLGLAVLSAHTVTAELALGELVQLDVRGLPAHSRWHVVVPPGKRLSAAAQAFKDWLFTHR
uniref:Ribulose-1,5-bisphosphate carboxylase regulator n=1 Tax=Hydrogenophaga pseudoflava TaxID=47421 RepID=Q9ZB33_HYDPS|nr:ribulose-1,5-bisphosphate carboxylase regulator [Hydrogenophaga pseudoflava]